MPATSQVFISARHPRGAMQQIQKFFVVSLRTVAPAHEVAQFPPFPAEKEGVDNEINFPRIEQTLSQVHAKSYPKDIPLSSS
jgi:hypothetical protein